MSYEDGWAALNLEKPGRIPRTEYSADMHWELITTVTGLKVDEHSSPLEKQKASTAFMKAWNYDFFWSTLISSDEFGSTRTSMGHAEYAAGGVDRDDDTYTLFSDPEDVLSFDPRESLGTRDKGTLTRRFEAHYQELCNRQPTGVNMTGIYITLVSGLIDLFGWEMLLMAAGVDQTRFGALANRYAGWMQQYFEALAEADVPVVMIHDDIVWSSGPFIQPAWYRDFIFSNYYNYFAPLLESGKKIIFTTDGNFDRFVDDITATGVHGLVLEPWTDLAAVVERYGQTHVIIGNVDTRILLNGTKDLIRAEVERCITLGRNCPGFFLAVGNHIPPNTPVENALFYNEVYEENCWR
jgi:hypothetical protein